MDVPSLEGLGESHGSFRSKIMKMEALLQSFLIEKKLNILRIHVEFTQNVQIQNNDTERANSTLIKTRGGHRLIFLI